MKLNDILQKTFEDRDDLSPGTQGTYRSQLDKIILPSFGDLEVGELTSLDIHEFIDGHKNKYKKRYIRTCIAQVASLLGAAEEKARQESDRETIRARKSNREPNHEIVQRAADLAQAVSAVKAGIRHFRTWKTTETENVMTPAQRATFLEAAKGSPHYMAILTAAETGIRPGEVCALQWGDIDFEGQKINVVRKVYRNTVENKLKNKRARKPAAMSNLLKRELLAYKKHRPATDTFWVFPGQDRSKPLSPNTLSKSCKTVLRECGLKQFCLYTNRHTAASMMLANGVSIAAVASQLGHATPQTTMSVYSHHIDTGENVANAISGS